MIPFAWSAGWNSPQAWNKYQDKVGGHLKNGDSGVRLFDRINRLPKREYVAPDFDEVEPISQLVPIYNIFASDNLTSRSYVVASQLIEPMFTVANDDAKLWQLQSGDKLTVKVNNTAVTLPVKLVDYLADGCIGYPVGQVPSLTAELTKNHVSVSFIKAGLTNQVKVENV